MSGHHHHHETSGKRMLITMLLNFSITAAELIGGLVSGSLSLISDALHNFSDGIAIIITWGALKLSQKPESDRYTFGLKRAQILAAVINSGVLLAISFYLVGEAVDKLFNPHPVDGRLMLVVAGFGLAANVVGTWLLHRGAQSNMNIKAAYLHLLSDAVSSVAVILGALAIMFWGQYWVDPVLTLLIAIYIGWESWKIIQSAVDILMLKTPDSIPLQALKDDICEITGVTGIHRVHLWSLDDHDIYFEAHIDVTATLISSTEPIAQRIETLLHERYQVNHVTLQFEVGQCLTGNHQILHPA